MTASPRPVLVWRGRTYALRLDAVAFGVPAEARAAPVLSARERGWVVMSATPEALSQRGLDRFGALRLPACLHGWQFDGERLAAVAGAWLDTWVVGLHPALLPALGRLRRIDDVAVADRFHLPHALAPGHEPDVDVPATRLADLDLFVYGTLQPGRELWPLIADLVDVVGAAVTGGTLTATPMGYPAAGFDATARGHVHGTLLRPRDRDAGRELYRRADRVEDAGRLFLRTTVRVHGPQRPGWAAAYAWNPERGAPPGEVVQDGRWKDRVECAADTQNP